MKFSNKQIDYLNQEHRTVRRIIEARPERGLMRYVCRDEMIQLLKELVLVERDEL